MQLEPLPHHLDLRTDEASASGTMASSGAEALRPLDGELPKLYAATRVARMLREDKPGLAPESLTAAQPRRTTMQRPAATHPGSGPVHPHACADVAPHSDERLITSTPAPGAGGS